MLLSVFYSRSNLVEVFTVLAARLLMDGYTIVGVPPQEIVMVKVSNEEEFDGPRRLLPSKKVRAGLIKRQIEAVHPRLVAHVRKNPKIQTRKKDSK